MAFHHTAARTEVRDLIVSYLQDLLLVQQPLPAVRTAEYRHTAVRMADKVQTVLFLHSLQDPQLQAAAPTVVFLLTAALMEELDRTA